MLYLLLMLNLLMTMMFMFMNHPLSMGLILLIQTLLICLMTGLFSYSLWFSYILFLIMLGGMLILFIYMTSLASNEMFNFSKNIFIMAMMMTSLFIFIYLLMDYTIIIPIFKNSNLMELLNNLMFLKNENLNSLKMIYNNPNKFITLMLINYLFLTLVATVKITNMNYGPLRQKF
uniref:NADH-ubiquinone oxidoreductase chain 6 n=1 Tax=Amphizoa insolens TaxID=107775 RepID=A0A343A3X2_AMPIN|nr:NADH dehydrogenase subunit 6 [Amphizoa insolens]AOY39250.1 NADH dehydrogenase subunit 6 [Amphizoa insolens]